MIKIKILDDDEETEWQHYLRASIETILRISDVLPEEVLRIVVRNPHKYYCTLQYYKHLK